MRDGFAVDHHALAWVSIAGVVLDILGGLYLAYDLLGGEHGPLRTLTRAVTYGLCFGVVYGLAFGPTFGLVTGLGLGLLLGWEFAGATLGRGDRTRAVQRTTLFIGVLRGAVLGVAAGLTFGIRFGLAFGLLGALAIVAVYRLGFSPSGHYLTTARPRFRWRAVRASVTRGLAIGGAAVLAGVMTRQSDGVGRGLSVGIVVTLVGVVVSTVSPFVEWWADHLPARRLGAVGAALLLLGLVLASLQYWVTVFDVPVH
ncbi:MAG: hypothetical protein ACR2PL_14475 [Dehalococcoidia bacterium]